MGYDKLAQVRPLDDYRNGYLSRQQSRLQEADAEEQYAEQLRCEEQQRLFREDPKAIYIESVEVKLHRIAAQRLRAQADQPAHA